MMLQILAIELALIFTCLAAYSMREEKKFWIDVSNKAIQKITALDDKTGSS